MKVVSLVCVAAAAAAVAAGCGEDNEPVSGSDAPAVTAPGTTIPYETGGADGSGADGRREADPRGGVAAGPDSGGGG